jgi:hypothetical protein
MGWVEEIEVAIERLPSDEYRRIVQWFRVREERRWDDQLMRTLPRANSISYSTKPTLNRLRTSFVSGRESEIRRYPAVLGTLSGIAI